MYKFIVFGLLVAAVATISAEEQNLDCLNHEDQISCFSAKLMNTVSRVARSTNIRLINGVSLVRDNSVSSKFFYSLFICIGY